jgi:predicted ATPase/transcriptional regulator with XRE-family HTH domain
MLSLEHRSWYIGPDKNPTPFQNAPDSHRSVSNPSALNCEKDGSQVEAPSSFGEWLRARRKALDLTQFQLAEQVGCAEDTIGRFEAGTRRPSRQVAILLAEALRVPAQSQDDFIHFAREGGSVDWLERSPAAGDIHTAPGPLQLASAVASVSPIPPRNQPASWGEPYTWVPYLSTLPQSLTPLIGREAEVAAAAEMLRSGQTRLLTLTGPPGVGKTRLSLALASALTPTFPDGICFVSLAPLREPDLLALTVAHALGLSDSKRGLQSARLLDFMRHKRLLLVLDNFEHILAATHQVAEWLSASAHLKVLVTSRSALHLRGERLFSVSTLPVPPTSSARSAGGSDLSELAALAAYPSVALFVERAQAVDPVFRLSESNAQVIAELCRRVGGLPLAIELAAARINLLTPQEIQTRLGSSLKLLTGGARDLPTRHQTLRGAIDWSYGLMGPGEQTLFARLSVFVGGCTLSAAEAICNAVGDLPFDMLDGLSSLIENSLLKREEALGESRYLMLEMILGYASEELERRGEAEAIRRQHAEYYLSLSEVARRQFSGAEQSLWLDRLEREHDNLRAALEWSRSQASSAELSLRLAASLGLFWEYRGTFTEARQRLAAALSGPGAGAPELMHLRAEVLGVASVTAFHQGDYTSIPPLDNERLELYTRAGDKPGMASALTQLARAAVAQGNYASAHSLLEQTLAVRREIGTKSGISHAFGEMGALARCEGDYAMARSYYEQSLALAKESNQTLHIAWEFVNLGHVAHYEGDCEQAKRLFDEGLVLFRQIGEPRGIANCLFGLAGVAGSQGLPQRAAQLFGSAETILGSTGSELEPADQMEYLRNLAASKSQIDPAEWQSFWSRGEAMPVEEAIAYALGGG